MTIRLFYEIKLRLQQISAKFYLIYNKHMNVALINLKRLKYFSKTIDDLIDFAVI